MRLTETDRRAFVRAVMGDVPHVDYTEQMNKLVFEEMRQKLPPQVVALMMNGKLKGYLNWHDILRIHQPNGAGAGVFVTTIADFRPSSKLMDELAELVLKRNAQLATHTEMQQKLRAAIDGCRTRKQAAEMFPELETYLPQADAPKTENLPAVANVIADLSKLGWPQGKVPA